MEVESNLPEERPMGLAIRRIGFLCALLAMTFIASAGPAYGDGNGAVKGSIDSQSAKQETSSPPLVISEFIDEHCFECHRVFSMVE